MLGRIDELIIIILIIMMLFGAKKVPELSRSVGKAAKEVRKAFDDKDNSPSSGHKNKQV
jgi:sec-independent protein translocase protein TatA